MSKTTVTALSITGNSAYKWTESSVADEWYLELAGGGDPSLAAPFGLVDESGPMTEATVGTLTEDEWDYGDGDTLGYSTIYVKMGATEIPDTDLIWGSIVASWSTAQIETAGAKVHEATGSGAMSETITIERPSTISGIMLHLSSVGVTAEDFQVAINSDSGSAYDTVLLTQDMNTITDFYSNTEIKLNTGDDLLITYTNTDASTWGLEVVWGDA